MIPDYGRYYGCVFTQLLEHWHKVTIEKLDVGMQGVYVIERSVPLYIKFSRQRKGPWAFTFQADHQTCHEELVRRFGRCITALVCGKDGVVALDNLQLREVLDDKIDQQEGVTIRRKLRHMYSVSGTNGKLARKVGRDSLLVLVDRFAQTSLPDQPEQLVGMPQSQP